MTLPTSVAHIERMLLSISQRFGATLQLDELLSEVLDAYVLILEAQRAVFAVWDDHGNLERAVVHNVDWDGDLEHLPVSRTLLEHVRSTGEAAVVPDVGLDARVGARESVRLNELRMLVGVPVPGRNGVTGVLYADSSVQAGWVQAPQRELLPALGRLVATALENARLYEEQRVRARLLHQMVHDLKGPLQVQQLGAQELLEELAPGPARQTAQDLYVTSQHARGIVDFTLQLARLETGLDLQPETLSLPDAVTHRWAPLRGLLALRQLTLLVDLSSTLPSVDTAPDVFLRVLDNLMGNAIKYSLDGLRPWRPSPGGNRTRPGAGRRVRRRARRRRLVQLERRVGHLLLAHASGHARLTGCLGPSLCDRTHPNRESAVSSGGTAIAHGARCEV